MDVTQILILLLVVAVAAIVLRPRGDDEDTDDDAQPVSDAPGTALALRQDTASPTVGGPRAGGGPDPRSGSPGDPPAQVPGSGATSAGTQDDPQDRPTTPRPAASAFRGRTRLFGIGGLGAGQAIDGPYAVVGFVANGFAPMKDSLIEVAVLHADGSGTIDDEFVTLIRPPDGEPGASFLHGLTTGELALAPTFAELGPQILHRLDGRIVVAHHADLLEQFVDATLMATGVLLPSRPALDTYALATRTFPTRNHRLTTLAAHLRIDQRPGSSALADARTVAAVLPHLLRRHGERLRYPCPLPPASDRPAGGSNAVERAHRLVPDPPTDRWVSDLLTRIPGGARELNDARVASYLEALSSTLVQGRVAASEVRVLTGLLARAGYSASDIRALHERLCESLRQAAFTNRRLTSRHIRHLRAAATSLGVPTYFDDLVPPPAPPAPEPGSGTFSRPVRKPVPPPPPPHLPRCGRCLGVGHYTSACPRRERGPVSPVAPVTPIGE